MMTPSRSSRSTRSRLLRIAAPVIVVFLGKVRLTIGKQGSHLILLTHDGTGWSALGRRDVALARETVFSLSKEQTTHQGQPTAGCGDIDPCRSPCTCERLSTPSTEGYARIMLRGSTTLKTAVSQNFAPSGVGTSSRSNLRAIARNVAPSATSRKIRRTTAIFSSSTS